MELIYKLLKKDPDNRENVIIATSVLGIIVNVIVATVKIVIGIAVSSIAVISEGINNASDSVSAVVTIVGTKLSTKHPTKEHPFGFGRIEYLTSLLISILILFTGLELLKNSVSLIFHPAELNVSYITLIIVAISAVVKLLLGSFCVKEGKRVDSSTLIAVGTDSKTDSIVSVVTIGTALVYILTGKNIDAYAGIFTSIFILKAGYELIKETVSNILGQAADKELATELYRIIRAEPIVLNAADMILHNYGPESYSGSVNIEIDHNKSVGEIYAAIHKLQLKIMHEKNIVMVFGVYAVDYDHENMNEMRRYIADFVRKHEHITSYHALYIDQDNNDIYCDLIVDYELQDWDGLRAEFTDYMAQKYPGQRLELVVETDFV